MGKDGETKGKRCAGRRPENVGVVLPAQACGETLYALLRVAEDCDDSELRAAYRQRALEEHPDKGGSQERFDEITRAWGILENADRRDAYDAELSKGRARAQLVEGGPARPREAGGAEQRQDLTKKTAPRIGSVRNKDNRRCESQWIGETSGGAMVAQIRLAIQDDQASHAVADPGELVTDQASSRERPEKPPDELVEALWEKFVTLNPGVKKQWLGTLSGRQRQALKDRAKVQEAKDLEKKKAWLSGKSGKR
ncbi:unnamed protein product [Prorocentrum cordatum]|uniref:J domain-containing protein n=1 Tax=Prorocentrum cordatum TaxID=2364126 RepID=A0ABN9UQT3_9DINO|nr:unnamed protein product [Polarella glacialis]|mmetsp:Transcript_98546/g.256813  ORF Transcript_98546/g.256813 Transcript_98546/m.256813 type:complete len:253 (+) Transcript_98546:86-844(+)